MSPRYFVPVVVVSSGGGWSLVAQNLSWLDVLDVVVRAEPSGGARIETMNEHLGPMSEDCSVAVATGSGSGSLRLRVTAHAEGAAMCATFELAV